MTCACPVPMTCVSRSDDVRRPVAQLGSTLVLLGFIFLLFGILGVQVRPSLVRFSAKRVRLLSFSLSLARSLART